VLDRDGDIPAAALTALTRPEDADRLLAAGFRAHVPKPTTPDAIVDAVARLLGDRALGASRPL
jgi:CheY-like chemotaxis protein